MSCKGFMCIFNSNEKVIKEAGEVQAFLKTKLAIGDMEYAKIKSEIQKITQLLGKEEIQTDAGDPC